MKFLIFLLISFKIYSQIDNTQVFKSVYPLNITKQNKRGIKIIGAYIYLPQNIEFIYAQLDLRQGEIGLVGADCTKKITMKGGHFFSNEVGKNINQVTGLNARILFNGPFFDYDGNKFVKRRGRQTNDRRYHPHLGEGCTTVESALVLNNKIIKPLNSTIHHKMRGLLTIQNNMVRIHSKQEQMKLSNQYSSIFRRKNPYTWIVGGYSLFETTSRKNHKSQLLKPIPPTDEFFDDKSPTKKVARTGLGIHYENGNDYGYLVDVVVIQPGPGALKLPGGASIADLQEIFQALKVDAAINVDGGGSSQFWFMEPNHTSRFRTHEGDCFPTPGIPITPANCRRVWRPVPVFFYFK